MSKISLVTGGAGFIGSHVARRCLSLGHRVIVADDLSGGFEENIPSGAEFRKGSVSDDMFVRTLFDEFRFDHVYHLAAYAAEGLSHFIRRFNYENNLIGSVLLINASVNSHSVQRFVFTSSIAVYGAAQSPMTEDIPPSPEDPYGISKLAVEMDLKAAQRLFGLDYTVFRPHNVYGEHQNIGDRYRNVIGIFMSQLMRGEPMTIFGDGRQTRAFSYIDDVAPAIADCVHIAETRNEIFNIGADTPYSVLELAAEVARAMGVPASIRHLEARDEVVHAFSSHGKAAKAFGLREFVPLKAGIGKMAQWALEKGPRRGSTFSGVEIPDKLPPSWAEDILGKSR
jgi:UDP-glucose 4-epimerase